MLYFSMPYLLLACVVVAFAIWWWMRKRIRSLETQMQELQQSLAIAQQQRRQLSQQQFRSQPRPECVIGGGIGSTMGSIGSTMGSTMGTVDSVGGNNCRSFVDRQEYHRAYHPPPAAPVNVTSTAPSPTVTAQASNAATTERANGAQNANVAPVVTAPLLSKHEMDAVLAQELEELKQGIASTEESIEILSAPPSSPPSVVEEPSRNEVQN